MEAIPVTIALTRWFLRLVDDSNVPLGRSIVRPTFGLYALPNAPVFETLTEI